MPALTTAQIKNYVRRAFREIVDPSPDKKDVPSIWIYFNNQCAYCGRDLVKANKDGHIDHLVAASNQGLNHISNRVLSCSTCNEKEKLSEDWEVFLRKKCNHPLVFSSRKAKIDAWLLQHSGTIRHSPEHIELAKKFSDEINGLFEMRVQELRSRVREGKIAQA